MKTGIELIAIERERQIAVEGFTAAQDDSYTDGQLANAAACYAKHPGSRKCGGFEVPKIWPWSPLYWKPTFNKGNEGRIEELVKAGALIVAEIDRLRRIDNPALAPRESTDKYINGKIQVDFDQFGMP